MQKLQVPVISSPNGMGCLDMTDPLSLGFIGRNGAFPANEAGRHADLVIAIGERFDDRSASSWLPGYSWNFPHSKLIHVDLDPAELGRNYPPDLGVLAVRAAGVLYVFSCVVDALPVRCLRRKPGANLLVAAVFRTKRLLREHCLATCPRRRRPGQARR